MHGTYDYQYCNAKPAMIPMPQIETQNAGVLEVAEPHIDCEAVVLDCGATLPNPSTEPVQEKNT